MKKIGLILMAVVMALSLVGCGGIADIHGGGVVTVYSFGWGELEEPFEAHVALNFMCNDNKNSVRGNVVWNDPVTPVQFTARMPWTPVDVFTSGTFTTCAEAAAAALEAGMSTGAALINAQGQETGLVYFVVSQPNTESPCGDASIVGIMADFEGDYETDYSALGCLDKGNIVFQ